MQYGDDDDDVECAHFGGSCRCVEQFGFDCVGILSCGLQQCTWHVHLVLRLAEVGKFAKMAASSVEGELCLERWSEPRGKQMHANSSIFNP